jgi:hypothetical protein
MVALDEHGEPSEVPPIIASTPAEQRRQREAGLRRENRLAERAQILAHRERSESGALYACALSSPTRGAP